MNIDIGKSRRVAKLVMAQRKQCWRNAALASILLKNGLYVEGWIILPVAGGIVIEHGWALTQGILKKDMTIIDPTLCDDDWLPEIEYFASEVFTTQQLVDHEGTLPILDYRDERHRQGYINARVFIARSDS